MKLLWNFKHIPWPRFNYFCSTDTNYIICDVVCLLVLLFQHFASSELEAAGLFMLRPCITSYTNVSERYKLSYWPRPSAGLCSKATGDQPSVTTLYSKHLMGWRPLRQLNLPRSSCSCSSCSRSTLLSLAFSMNSRRNCFKPFRRHIGGIYL